jgi:broad specificity phosphatase PhoE
MEVLTKHIAGLLSVPGPNVLFIRAAESISSLSGTLAGWTDSKLSDYGKKQANQLFSGIFPFLPQFAGFYTSDLQRAALTLKIATLYQVKITEDERLREIFFGDHECEHFDSMPEALRNEINTMAYQAPNGENWGMVRRRAEQFMRTRLVSPGTYVCMSHGGLICTLTHAFGVQDVLPNCSVAGFTLSPTFSLNFSWSPPEILNR